MDTLIVGAGDVGRWFAEMVPWQVAFADIDRAAAEEAATAFGDRGSVAGLDEETAFDVVVVAVPMRVTEMTIEEQAKRATRAVIDLSGSMCEPLDAMAATAPGAERVSFHQLFAPEHGPGRIAYSVGSDGAVTREIREAFERAGNELVEIEPDIHDEAMGTIQGRAHAAILAFALAASEVPDELSTPVYDQLDQLVERVTGGSPGVYADIQARFDGASEIRDAADRLDRADRDTFEALYRDAR